uniref:Sulfotransferase family protein n=1 Tax=Pithovirus LCPAC202 TaxID=2506592 RepID=A0A481Z5I0_9VIRU|nr:MAG: sulfotransferase family protein [Pithovirus LCPAC202]
MFQNYILRDLNQNTKIDSTYQDWDGSKNFTIFSMGGIISFLVKYIFSSKRPEFDPTLDGRIPSPEDNIWDKIPFVFLHIPRSGGTSIGSRLPKGCHYWHLLPCHYPSRTISKMVTIVRNPYDRAVSAYFFFCNKGFMGEEEWCVEMVKPYPTFQEWVLEGLEEDMLYLDRQEKYPHGLNPMISQTEWLLIERVEEIYQHLHLQNPTNLKTENGLYVPANKIGHFETLDQDAKRLFKINKLPHFQGSTHQTWQSYYRNYPQVQRKIYQLYQRDFNLLGYSEEIDQSN